MSAESPGSGGENQDAATEHPAQRFFTQYFGAIAQLLTPENKFKIRRAFEGAIIIAITLGFIWWLYELAIYLAS